VSRSLYRVSIKSFPDYKPLLQENYVEYKHIFYHYLSHLSYFLLELSYIKKMFFFSRSFLVIMFVIRKRVYAHPVYLGFVYLKTYYILCAGPRLVQCYQHFYSRYFT